MMSQSFRDRLFPKLPSMILDYPTPFYVYDEVGIREGICRLNKAFNTAGVPFQEFFAVKACPNPRILEISREEGAGFDCSSLPEITLAKARAGAEDHDVMFTSNNTSDEEFKTALTSGVTINLDDITLIKKLSRVARSIGERFPKTICFRYNPGPARDGNEIIGKPEEAKYGVADWQIVQAYKMAKELGAERFGLHTMICSNQLDYRYLVETVAMLFQIARRLHSRLGIKLNFINMGGGIGIPYRPGQKEVPIEKMAEEINALFDDFERDVGYYPSLYMESGRWVTGPHGVLVTQVINQKHTYKEFRGVDACMSSLMRPGIYGAYHHITVLDKNGRPKTGRRQKVNVVGSLCENCDQFAKDRLLPVMEENDILVIEDAGAHGIAMTYQYNGRMRPPEFLLQGYKNRIRMIGRAETEEDLFVRYV
ncbi:MAG: diaminopimelate decarboxylase [Candidatus Paceibacterota bacterium]|jgi:diaminopimelate decarboxylase